MLIGDMVWNSAVWLGPLEHCCDNYIAYLDSSDTWVLFLELVTLALAFLTTNTVVATTTPMISRVTVMLDTDAATIVPTLSVMSAIGIGV